MINELVLMKVFQKFRDVQRKKLKKLIKYGVMNYGVLAYAVI